MTNLPFPWQLDAQQGRTFTFRRVERSERPVLTWGTKPELNPVTGMPVNVRIQQREHVHTIEVEALDGETPGDALARALASRERK